ncbi:NAD-dependent epimerase/dehydratase family protein [Pseudomonas sp. S2_H01]
MNVDLASAEIRTQVQLALERITVVPQLAGKHLLITGATGFFGKWLLAVIAGMNARGAEIAVTAVSRSPERFLAQYPLYRDVAWVTWLEGDVRALAPVKLVRAPDLILHAATDTSAAGQADGLHTFDTIVEGARSVLELAERTGAGRVLFTGSGAQYGPLTPGVPVREDDFQGCDSASADSAYAEAKRAQELLAALFAKQHGIDVILTRCFAFAGPGLSLDGHFAIGNFVRDALTREELILNSSGQSVRSYLYAGDLVVWLLTLLIVGQSGQAYNVGSDQALTITELAQKVLERIAPHKPLRILGSPDSGPVRSWYVPDIQKARGLGLDVWTSLDRSIDSMAAWVREQRSFD